MEKDGVVGVFGNAVAGDLAILVQLYPSRLVAGGLTRRPPEVEQRLPPKASELHHGACWLVGTRLQFQSATR